MVRNNDRRILQDVNRYLARRAARIATDAKLFREPKKVDCWPGYLNGEPVERMIIYLRSDVGCQFAIKHGPCAGCHHSIDGTAGRRVPLSDKYVLQYRHAVARHGLRPLVCVYNEGNMLNPWELPSEQLLAIVTDLAENGVKRLVLETRPEYINATILSKLRECCGSMEVEIGIGLESVNDVIRNEVFLKRMTLQEYELSIGMLKDFGIRSLAYVIVKPAFINEAQAIRDAVATSEYAFSVGTDAISLEPIGVEPETITDYMARQGSFRPAWLWSVIDIVRRSHHLGEVRIGGFQFAPLPVTTPRNCDECTDRALKVIDAYNRTYNVKLLDDFECSRCRRVYQEELASLQVSIDDDLLKASLRQFVQNFSV